LDKNAEQRPSAKLRSDTALRAQRWISIADTRTKDD